SAQELREFVSAGGKYVGALDRFLARLDFYRQQGRRVVFTNGCFDILHRGHITYLNRAKTLGDVLVVGVNSDDSIRRLKGPSRPGARPPCPGVCDEYRSDLGRGRERPVRPSGRAG